jgi:hypothetical protein
MRLRWPTIDVLNLAGIRRLLGVDMSAARIRVVERNYSA